MPAGHHQSTCGPFFRFDESAPGCFPESSADQQPLSTASRRWIPANSAPSDRQSNGKVGNYLPGSFLLAQVPNFRVLECYSNVLAGSMFSTSDATSRRSRKNQPHYSGGLRPHSCILHPQDGFLPMQGRKFLPSFPGPPEGAKPKTAKGKKNFQAGLRVWLDG